MGNLAYHEKIMAQTNGNIFIRALLNVYQEVDKPGSTHWELSPTSRAHLASLVADEWLLLTSTSREDLWQFPFTEAYIINAWVSYRKLELLSKNELEKYLVNG